MTLDLTEVSCVESGEQSGKILIYQQYQAK